jgi:hypothetical protein
MLKHFLPFLSLVGLVLLTGCTHTRYEWNNYDTTLYDYYKEPAQVEQYAEALQQTVIEAESEQKVPPGIYAEYGYVLFVQGYNTEAIEYFQKESDKWPESRVLMTKMVANAQERFKKQGDKAKPPPKIEPKPSNPWQEEYQ